MPIYEYRCGACGHEIEALQKLSDEPLKECSECSDGQLKRLISAPNFRLKGSGWYETDFKSESDTKRNLADKGEAQGAGKDDKPKPDDTGAKAPAKTEAADKPKSTPKPSADTPSTKAAAKPKAKPSTNDSAT